LKILFDTSILVAGLIAGHSRHAQAFAWFKRAKAGEFETLVCSHSLAELYSVLTTLPLKPRITPHDARRLIEESIKAIASLVPVAASDYARALDALVERNLSGGIVYDALIAMAAKKAQADSLLTLNPKDFKRFWREGDPEILEP
jgi:predicted nucleic acid-binding protein